jgi:hypothetical protein
MLKPVTLMAAIAAFAGLAPAALAQEPVKLGVLAGVRHKPGGRLRPTHPQESG